MTEWCHHGQNRYLCLICDEIKSLLKEQESKFVPNFSHPKLIAKYGNWIRVQVAFYDFLFTEAKKMCPQVNEHLFRNTEEGREQYEILIKAIEKRYTLAVANTVLDPIFAWNSFLKNEGIEIS